MENQILFKKAMSLFGEKFDKKFSEFMLKTIWEALKQFDDDQCEIAFKKVFLTGRFFKDLLPDMMAELQGSEMDRAVTAWLSVNKAVRQIGPYSSVKFDDPAIHSVVDAMGGWFQFQNCTMEDWKWRRKEFEGLYRVMSKQLSHPEYLAGISETQNRTRGFDAFIEAPVEVKALPTGEIKMIPGGKAQGQLIAMRAAGR